MPQEKTHHSASIYLGSKFLIKGLSFLLIPVWTSAFSPEEYGIIGTLVALAGVVMPIVMLGLPTALVRLKVDCGDSSEWQSLVASVSFALLVSGIVFVFGGMLFGSALWKYIPSGDIPFFPYVPILILSIFLGFFSRLGLAIHQASKSAKRASIYEQTLSLGGVCFALIFVLGFGMGVRGYFFGALVGGLLCLILFLFEFRSYFSFSYLSKAKIKNALSYGLPMVPHALSAWILNLSDRIMLNDMAGLKEVGIYSLAANFGALLSMVAVSLNQAIFPGYLQVRRAGGTAERNAQGVLKGSLILSLMAVIILGVGPPVLFLMVNERFLEALPLLPPVLGGFFFFGLGLLFRSPLLFAKRTGTVALITLGGALVNVLGNLYFIPIFGSQGAAWMTLGSYGVTFLIVLLISRKLDPMSISLRALGMMIGAPFLMVIFTWLYPDLDVVNLSLRTVMTVCIAVFFVVYFRRLNRPVSVS